MHGAKKNYIVLIPLAFCLPLQSFELPYKVSCDYCTAAAAGLGALAVLNLYNFFSLLSHKNKCNVQASAFTENDTVILHNKLNDDEHTKDVITSLTHELQDKVLDVEQHVAQSVQAHREVTDQFVGHVLPR